MCFVPSLVTGSSSNERTTFKEEKLASSNAVLTWYTIGNQQVRAIQTMQLSNDDARHLIDQLQALKIELQKNQLSQQAQNIQQDILSFAKSQGLLPTGYSFKTVQSPLECIDHLRLPKIFSSPLIENRDSEFFCNFITTGSGSALPIIILPRLIPILLTPIPRVFVSWHTPDGITSVGGLRSGTGFIAFGDQKGIALGFWGIGFSIFLPPISEYGLFGYAFYARVTAEDIEQWPPNSPPEITGVDPPDRQEDVPLATSELRFQIADADEDLMSYTVITEPDIGSGTGSLKKDGVYAIPIQDLTYDKSYTWTIEVTDGADTITQTFRFSTEGRPPFDPFNEGWNYRKKITVDHTKVASSFNNFVILISNVDPDLVGKTQADGGDILFMDDIGVASKLYHEIEYYNPTTGRLISWVKIPSLSSSEDTIFYMYYGNPSTTDLPLPAKVWDSSYVGVYHLGEDGTGIRYDSTSNAKHVTPQHYEGDEATPNGKIDGTDKLSGEAGTSPEYLKGSDNSQYLNSAAGTVSAWIYIESSSASGPESIITKHERRGGCEFFIIDANKAIQHSYFDRADSYKWKDTISTVINWVEGTWYYVVGTRGPAGNNIYLNGEEVTYDTHYTGSVACSETLNGYLNIGEAGSGAYEELGEGAFGYTGMIDEARISLTQRSPVWILTEYRNQNDPSSFITLGFEEQKP